MNVAAPVSTGNICNAIMIGKGSRVTVAEMKFDPHPVSSPVFHFLRRAARNHTIRQKEKFLKVRVGHLPSHTALGIKLPHSFGKTG